MKIAALILTVLLSMSAIAKDAIPYNVLERDMGVVKDIKVDGENIFIKIASANLSDEIRVRISDGNRDYYRTWFHGGLDLVSTGFRGNNVWSDRVQTKAGYIEYWLGDKLILHLEKQK